MNPPIRCRILGPEIRYKAIGSTNDVSRMLALQGAPEGTTVWAEEQSDGHGRFSRRWDSSQGGLFLSVILRPAVSPADAPQLAIAAGVAVRDALSSFSDVAFTLKWPNDVLVLPNGRKICGILCEASVGEDDLDFVIVGIGINVNNNPRGPSGELARTATSVRQESGRETPIERVCSAVVDALDERYCSWLEFGFPPIRKAWLSANCTIGNEISIHDDCFSGRRDFRGVAEGMDERGGLIVRDRAGFASTFDYGEVSIRSAGRSRMPISNSDQERNVCTL